MADFFWQHPCFILATHPFYFGNTPFLLLATRPFYFGNTPVSFWQHSPSPFTWATPVSRAAGSYSNGSWWLLFQCFPGGSYSAASLVAQRSKIVPRNRMLFKNVFSKKTFGQHPFWVLGGKPRRKLAPRDRVRATGLRGARSGCSATTAPAARQRQKYFRKTLRDQGTTTIKWKPPLNARVHASEVF